jgi:hypothetical protein
MGDLSGALGSGPAAGRGRCSAAPGCAEPGRWAVHVARAVASDGPSKYEQEAGPTSFTPFEAAVRRLLVKRPDKPAMVIAERIGWTGSITCFRDNVRRLRLEHRPVDPCDRLTWLLGTLRNATCGSRRRRSRKRRNGFS